MVQVLESVVSGFGNCLPVSIRRRWLASGICLQLGILCFIFFVLLSSESIAKTDRSGEEASQAQSLLEMTPEEQSLLAERFAPLLVYHKSEEYFPCNPLFPLEIRGANSGLPSEDRDSAIARLGTAESRSAAYRSLTMEQKADLATVYYRVYPLKREPAHIIVIEYWLYYVQNAYRARASILPLWFNTSHPNDLEYIHVLLKAQPGDSSSGKDSSAPLGYTIEKVYASAHEGVVPANRYRYTEQPASDSIQFLMELGSHASAADINRDGIFTPGLDGDSEYKMLWGVRDKGVPWIKYSRSYMLPRSNQNSIAFSHAASESAEPSDAGGVIQRRRFGYQLVPVEKLADDFFDLDLTNKQRKEAYETQVSWLMRAMGRSNGSSGSLLLPREPAAGNGSLNIRDLNSTERGFMVGMTNLVEEPGVFAGGRYAFLNGKRYLPDLIFEADAILTTRGEGFFLTQALLSYPIDATTKLMGGYGFVTNSLRFDRRQWDWIGAIEARLGSIRLYGAMRTWGSVTRSAVDFRVSYFF